MLVLDKISLSCAEISLIGHRIIVIEYLNEEPISVEGGIQILEACVKLSGNAPSIYIHNMGDKYINFSESLRFMGSQLTAETHKYLARGIVCTNPAGRLQANNFIKMYKPLIPTQLFNTLTEALQWSEGILAKGK